MRKRVSKKDKPLRDMAVYDTFQSVCERYPFWCWVAQVQQVAIEMDLTYGNTSKIICEMKKAISE